jgi:glycosyltransferase involved in cell wall biosynthesis
MGVPIVSTRVTGLDAVQDGVTGILVPAHQSGPLAAAIIRLAYQPDLRKDLGAAAIEHIRKCFTEDRVNHLWMAEYRRLIHQSLPDQVFEAAQMETRT